MDSVELAKRVYWVGAIDWDIRFCGAYTTPRGTTYNAYLIVDEKIALVDTVKKGFYNEMLERIRKVINPKDIDYIITNHIEADHSGALEDIIKIADKAEIILSEKGKDGLFRHYHGGWPVKTVKTEDELKLGKKTLMFISAPMLHWPDNMMTYLEEDRILFSNDPFGQHIATSERFEDEVGEIVMNDAARYFANIVLPYAPVVKKKIDEIKEMGLNIEVIAPAHGLIWRKNPERIVNAYLKWSQPPTKKKATIIYDTMWGSTSKMAKAISEGLSSEGVEYRMFSLRQSDSNEILKEILDSRAILVGSPTINTDMFPSVAEFLALLRGLKPRDRLGIAFGSYGWGGGAVKKINEELKNARLDVIEPGLQIKYVPDESGIKECIRFGKFIAKEIIG